MVPKFTRISTADQPTVVNDQGASQSRALGRFDLIPGEAIVRMAQVMQEGSEKYAVDNWHRIPGYEHINHALQHLALLEMGRTEEDHLGHALTRLAFAVWSEANGGRLHERGGPGRVDRETESRSTLSDL